jgi:hypothetical protein
VIPVTVRVESLTLLPGRPDVIILHGVGEGDDSQSGFSFTVRPPGVVIGDGQEMDAGAFFAWFVSNPVRTAKVHQDPERYGLSARTEFCTAAPEAEVQK